MYRKVFHRLSHFPGPWLAGATKLWHAWQCRTGRNYLLIEKLRGQYGPFIRTGPLELIMVDPSVPLAIDGPGNKCSKPDWYDLLSPDKAVNTTRSIADHAKRRRIRDQGFSPKALAVYEGRVTASAEKLASSIEQLALRNEPVNVSDWFYWFTFDVMGEFAFARSFNMLVDEKWHFAPRMIRTAMRLLGTFSPVPDTCTTQMKGVLPGVSYWLIDASVKRGTLEADREWLNGDAIAIIIAGR